MKDKYSVWHQSFAFDCSTLAQTQLEELGSQDRAEKKWGEGETDRGRQGGIETGKGMDEQGNMSALTICLPRSNFSLSSTSLDLHNRASLPLTGYLLWLLASVAYLHFSTAAEFTVHLIAAATSPSCSESEWVLSAAFFMLFLFTYFCKAALEQF